MIESFEVKKQDGEEILYVYLSYQYEFGTEFLSSLKEKGIKKQIQDWILKNNIAFHGKKVMVVASGILLTSFLLQNGNIKPNVSSYSYLSPSIVTEFSQINTRKQENQQEEIKETVVSNNQTSIHEAMEEKQKENKTEMLNQELTEKLIEEDQVESSSPIQEEMETKEETIEDTLPSFQNPITIYRNGVPVTLALEGYVVGVVAAEMPASFPIEALQAQTVLARTYALKYIQEGKTLTDSTATQVYYDESQLRNMWGNHYDSYLNKIKNAVSSTNGQTLTYQGNYIDAVYHSTSNGKTEAARNVWGYEIPYLQSVDSHWDVETTFYHGKEYKDMNQLLNLFGISNLEDGDIEVISRNESGRVKEVKVQNQIYQGVDLRMLLGLKSADFDIAYENGNLVITTRGWGHGVGMSQYGAYGMAKEGYSYQQILSHYYPGTLLQ